MVEFRFIAPVRWDRRPTVRREIEVIAVASFGGHFEQLLQLREAWIGRTALYVTTRRDTIDELAHERVAFVQDCHTGEVIKSALCLAQVTALFLRYRPRLLVTTGALPGLLAAVAARLVGARVIWVDSVANSEELSTSGCQAKRLAHAHFSQWPEVAQRKGSSYGGSLF